jgi:hypothetical protein
MSVPHIWDMPVIWTYRRLCPRRAFAKAGSTADVCLSLRTLFVRSTLIGRGCLRHPEGPGGV